MALTSEEITLYTARLAEADEARHQLLIGGSVVIQHHDGRRMEFKPADIRRLDAYIAELRRLLAGTSRPSRTLRVYQSGNGFN